MPLFKDLLQKFITDELSRDELQSFMALAQEPANQALIREAVAQHMDASSYTDLTAGMDIDDQFLQVLKRAGQEGELTAAPPVHRVHFLRKWWWAAASALLLLGAGSYFWWPGSRAKAVAIQPATILPGKEGAILTLADGTQVILDSLGNGVIATQNGTRVVLQDGRLAYDLTGKTGQENAFNTMTTPKGRQFQILLPDGTRVWLNAASSIKYPTAFTGQERSVEISGEAYFEVAQQARSPFFVHIGNRAKIEVLGTAFNVQAYQDGEGINTTLVTGAVRVMTQNSVVLKPGQQAVVRTADPSKTIRVEAADVDKVTAWKNGYFNFEDLSLQEAMKQLERWYDITVEVEKDVPDIDFFGDLSRNVNLAELIEALKEVGSEAGVHFRIDAGRKLVVMRQGK